MQVASTTCNYDIPTLVKTDYTVTSEIHHRLSTSNSASFYLTWLWTQLQFFKPELSVVLRQYGLWYRGSVHFPRASSRSKWWRLTSCHSNWSGREVSFRQRPRKNRPSELRLTIMAQPSKTPIGGICTRLTCRWQSLRVSAAGHDVQKSRRLRSTCLSVAIHLQKFKKFVDGTKACSFPCKVHAINDK